MPVHPRNGSRQCKDKADQSAATDLGEQQHSMPPILQLGQEDLKKGEFARSLDELLVLLRFWEVFVLELWS
jgi:hypothetical protein